MRIRNPQVQGGQGKIELPESVGLSSISKNTLKLLWGNGGKSAEYVESHTAYCTPQQFLNEL